MENKKIGGGFLRYVLAEVYGYFSRGRGVSRPPKSAAKQLAGLIYKTLYLLCILMSIGGLGLLLYILGVWVCLDSLSLTLLGVGYLLFLFCVTSMVIMNPCKQGMVCI
jgi:hypothetical protein